MLAGSVGLGFVLNTDRVERLSLTVSSQYWNRLYHCKHNGGVHIRHLSEIKLCGHTL